MRGGGCRLNEYSKSWCLMAVALSRELTRQTKVLNKEGDNKTYRRELIMSQRSEVQV